MLSAQSVGDRIRLSLQRKNLTQTDLANELKVTQPAIGAIVSGLKPGRSLLPRIAEALGVPLEWLTIGDNPPDWARNYDAARELRDERNALVHGLAAPLTAAGADAPRPAGEDAELWKSVALLERRLSEQQELLRESDARNRRLEERIESLLQRLADLELRQSDEGSRGGRRKTTEVK